MHGTIHQVHQGSRFGLFDVSEGFVRAVRATQAKVDQVLVDFELVLEEGDFQLFSAKTAAQPLYRFPRASIRLICGIDVAQSSLNLAI